VNSVQQQAIDKPHDDRLLQSGFSLQSLLSLPILLRAAGSLVLLTAMSLFLFQHWNIGDDIQQYWMLLGFNALLALAGFTIGRLLGEAKGARTFLMLALAAVPINFAIMGAFLYSSYPLDSFSIQYPAFASWQLSESISLALPLVVGLLTALLVSWLGFLVLARDAAPGLILTSLLVNTTLLIPVRSSDHIAWLVLALIPGLIYAIRQITRNKPAMKTFEGRIAQLLLLLPVGLIIGRSLWFYPVGSFFYLTIALSVWWGLRIIGKRQSQNKVVNQWIEILSLIIAPIIALLFTDLAIVNWEISYDTALHLFAYSLATLYFERSLLGNDNSARYRMIASFVLAATAIGVLVVSGGTTNAILCIANGLLVASLSYMMRNRMLLIMGTAAFIAGIGYQLWYAVEQFNISGWNSLAVIGCLTIFAGSLVEKFGTRIKLKLQGLSDQIREWEQKR
jgi:hypothetical protein